MSLSLSHWYPGSGVVLYCINSWSLHLNLLCVKRPLSKRLKIGFQDQLSLKAGQKYCRMLKGPLSKRPKLVFNTSYLLTQVKSIAECSERGAILLTFIKLPFVIKIFVLSIFKWPFYTLSSFTVFVFICRNDCTYNLHQCFHPQCPFLLSSLMTLSRNHWTYWQSRVTGGERNNS